MGDFAIDGFALLPELIPPSECEAIAGQLSLNPGAIGSRCLLAEPWCPPLARRLQTHGLLRDIVPADHVAVQCTYFEKSADRNWLVAVHQDLSIPVAERVDDSSLTGWSEKEGALFVQAPVDLLEQLVAVRLHLDDCGPDDGPLRVVPGSHRWGRVGPEAAAEARSRSEVNCASHRGGILALRPLLLHASSKARGTSRRRVLHFVFGPRMPEHGLRWPRQVSQRR